MGDLGKGKPVDVYLRAAPDGLERQYKALLTPEAVNFLVELSLEFRSKVDELYAARLARRTAGPKIPRFTRAASSDDSWKVAPVGPRLQNRHLDLGDVSPSDATRFTEALRARVQGIQVDFDDGHCPNWANQITGLNNVRRAVLGEMPGAPGPSNAPLLLFRPRAWNMLEHNASVAGRELPGPLFDFGLIVFHTGQVLARLGLGPLFYLSKLESSAEARLWAEIFQWAELRLRLARGTIKACVLIENILAAFQMEAILYELREHSLGLNCGIWDYAASIVAKFGEEPSFLLPDRSKYVSMDRPFLSKYMDLVVRTCHKRGALATGGMAAGLLPPADDPEHANAVQKILAGKLTEIRAGVDGFMVYDIQLVEHVNELWRKHGGPGPNQIGNLGSSEPITEADLLTLPKGGVTELGLNHNITVGILFIYHWLSGRGVFELKGAIEDSATAEISKAQVWQWIRHAAPIEDRPELVTRNLVATETSFVLDHLIRYYAVDNEQRSRLGTASLIFLQLVNQRDFPEFITTYLNDAYVFRRVRARL